MRSAYWSATEAEEGADPRTLHALKLREAMPAQELHDKAWDTKHMFETCCLYRFRFVAAMGYSFVGPFTDPVSGPQYVALCTFLLGRARVVPNSGPKIGV